MKFSKSSLWEITKVIIISVLLATFVRTFIIQPFAVRGSSMESSFAQGDYLIINKISYYFSKPARGDVVVFRAPNEKSIYFIKRIIGLPGERVELQKDQIKIFSLENPNGFVLDEIFYDIILGNKNETSILLGDNEYFVLGDNRRASRDSRSWGALPKENLIGKVLLRAWPIDHVKAFGEIEY
ncbi:signal peptidase I [bacterium]|nr:signal peptidase I [bacterium]|tara:strand:+ start:3713 stop:4261 length:549 start_codon:yes stop_codon:yes gene_type:complete